MLPSYPLQFVTPNDVQYERYVTIIDCSRPAHLCLQVERGKPAPDCFTATAARMRVDPAECLVFEDAPSGVEVGLRKQRA